MPHNIGRASKCQTQDIRLQLASSHGTLFDESVTNRLVRLDSVETHTTINRSLFFVLMMEGKRIRSRFDQGRPRYDGTCVCECLSRECFE